MAEYIDRQEAIDRFTYESGDMIRETLETGEENVVSVKTIKAVLRSLPAADVAPVVRCKNCIYWKDRHIKMNDGTERPYTEEELHQFCGMVPLSIGINVSSYCTRVKLEDTNFWCGPDDFCNKGELADCMIWLKNKFGDLIPVHGWKAVGTTPEGDTIGQNDDGETFVFVDCQVIERRGTDERSERQSGNPGAAGV